MALSRANEFDTGSTLTETKIEGELDNIYNNALSLISPLTGALDTGATGQIIFPATQTASAGANTLDDYEEGSWTPVLTFATPGNLSVAYTTQVGRYIKVGRTVTIAFEINTSTFTHTTASGNCNITGVPFASVNTTGLNHTGSLTWTGITKASYTDIATVLPPDSQILSLHSSGSGVGIALIGTADMPTTGTVRLISTLTYFSAN